MGLAFGLAACGLFSGQGQLTFDAPGLSDATRRTAVRTAPDKSYEEEVVTWRRSWTEPPTAHIIRRTLNPGHKFVQVPKLDDFVSGFGRTATMRFGPERSMTSLGPVDHRLLRLGEIDCLAFRNLTAASLLIGYYCAPPGVTMTLDQARVLVHGLKLSRNPEVGTPQKG